MTRHACGAHERGAHEYVAHEHVAHATPCSDRRRGTARLSRSSYPRGQHPALHVLDRTCLRRRRGAAGPAPHLAQLERRPIRRGEHTRA